MQVLVFASRSTLKSHQTQKSVDTLHLDNDCQAEAYDAGLTGNYVALVSSTHRSILDLQYRDHVPLINSKVLL